MRPGTANDDFDRLVSSERIMSGVNLDRWPNEAEMAAELYGGAWSDLGGWARRCRPEGCVVCNAGRAFGVIGELTHTWITTDPDVAVYGYVCVISKAHAVEPFELPEADQAAFWKDAMIVAGRLNQLVRPVKMNYEIHGNTLPHLHMHLIPRQVDDAFVGRPVDLKETHHHYTDDELRQLRSAFTPLGS
jgi:diadenosine tetraphosphate (Ap4A) HIT family hydrolase